MADGQNNCLHEIFFEQAIQRAGDLDQYLVLNNKPVGPLHGLPISLKDQFHVKGVDTTMGYVGWIGSNLGIKDSSDAHQVESQITKELLQQGAVLYCKVRHFFLSPVPYYFGYVDWVRLGILLNVHR